MTFETKVWPDGDREFYFPTNIGANLTVCAYLADTEDIDYPRRPVVFVTVSGHTSRRWGEQYIRPPAEGIRHAAATGDPTLLLDWLLEHACDTRPWLAEAINAALGAGRAG